MRMIRLLLLLAVLAAGCQVQSNNPLQTGSSDVVCLWIAADKDAHVSYGRAGEEADRNFGKQGSLIVSGLQSITPGKTSYIHFPSPIVPSGSEVLEARLEVFMGGKNEDGTPDDITINGGMMTGTPWSPETVTWNTRPGGNNPAPSHFTMRLRSQNWCNSQNIAGFATEMIANPGKYDGLALHLPTQVNAHKSFYSNNDIRRKQNDLGLSPRLLVKLKLPAGKTASDISMPFLISDTDLALARPILMVRFSTGAEWPKDWNVAPPFD